jgi:hypothetical protein
MIWPLSIWPVTSSLVLYEVVQNIVLAFVFHGRGIPLAATGLIHPDRQWRQYM